MGLATIALLVAWKSPGFSSEQAFSYAVNGASRGASAPEASSLVAQARQDPNVRFPAPPKSQAAVKSLVGEVVTPQGEKLPQAVIHLKNKKTLEVRTRISDREGKFSFRGLDRDTDYEVHAEYQGAASSKKNVSSFDDRDEVYLVLEISTAK